MQLQIVTTMCQNRATVLQAVPTLLKSVISFLSHALYIKKTSWSIWISSIRHYCSLSWIDACLRSSSFRFLNRAPGLQPPHRHLPLCQSLLHLFEKPLVKSVNRFVTAEDQCLNGVREGLVFPHETVKGLQSTKSKLRPLFILKLSCY